MKFYAQSLKGITNIQDTSFNINSEYRKLKKSYPELQFVPENTSDKIVVKSGLVYCKSSERKLLTDAFYPDSRTKTKRVAIIILHGGGWRSGNRTMHHAMAKSLAEKGYVCFTPEYRLSTEALYPAAIHDVKSMIRWVRKQARKFNIDDSKIVIAGHSAGGQIAALAGTTNNNKQFEGTGCYEKYSSTVNAVIDIDGTLAFIHPESGEGDDSKKPSAATLWFGYNKTENAAIWREGSPLTHVGVYTPPTLFLNSSVARMHAGRNDFIKVLDIFKKYSRVYTFEKAPHSFCFFEPWFGTMIAEIDKFIVQLWKTSRS